MFPFICLFINLFFFHICPDTSEIFLFTNAYAAFTNLISLLQNYDINSVLPIKMCFNNWLYHWSLIIII